jgi:hypothetical protein
MVIDFHAHFTGEKDFLPRLLDLLPQAGIDHICLCSAGEMFGHQPNEVILDAALRHPEQISALAFIELGTEKAQMAGECAKRGFKGFKITNPRAAYDDPSFFPVFEKMEESGMPLLAHTGILARLPAQKGGFTNSNWMRPICLDAIVRRFPGLNIVGAHMGAPWHEEASMMARIHPNYYVDLTGAYWGGWRVPKSPAFFHENFFWENAWSKVLFGTDILAVDELVPSKNFHDALIARLGLSPAQTSDIYGGTAARLLKLQN